MSRRWLLLAIAAQLLVLAWMGAEREWIFRTGQVAYLRTAPIDPRDLFRGDFVRLRYDVNSVRREHLDPAIAPPGRERKRHEVVYTRLQPAGEGVYEAAGTSPARPAEGLFLRGRLHHHADLRFGTAGTDQHPTGVAQFGLGLAHGHGQFLGVGRTVLVHVRHVDEHLREPGHDLGQLRQALLVVSHRGQQVQTGEEPVAGGGVVQQDHVTGLFAA